MSELHDMKLGDIKRIAYAEVIRVPGGWVFVMAQSSTFVPYSEEGKGETDEN